MDDARRLFKTPASVCTAARRSGFAADKKMTARGGAAGEAAAMRAQAPHCGAVVRSAMKHHGR
jgi:hypothetical protein